MKDPDDIDIGNANAWQRFEVPVLAGLALLSMVLGVIGFSQYYQAAGKPAPFADVLYLSLQLFSLNSGAVEGSVPWALQISRFLAPFITLAAVLKALICIFRGELRALRLSRRKGHTSGWCRRRRTGELIWLN